MRWVNRRENGNPDYNCFAAGLNEEHRIKLYLFDALMQEWENVGSGGFIPAIPPRYYCVIPTPPAKHSDLF